MYEKNLTEDLRLRLSKRDMDFLREESTKRCVSVSECIRSIIGDYRRSIDTLEVFKNALELARNHNESGGELSHGDTETDINNKL